MKRLKHRLETKVLTPCLFIAGRLKARLHEREKRNGSDKKWNGSDKFLGVNDTWPVPVLPVPLKKGP